MLMEKRHNDILALLAEQQTITVGELSDRFGVSTVTIRNDLNTLEESGKVVRTHGGARLGDNRVWQEVAFDRRKRAQAKEKQAIGHVAASLIQPGETILLDSSSTAVAVAHALKQRTELSNITVATTGLWTAIEMIDTPHIDVVLAGGHVRNITGTVGGLIAAENLSRFRFQRAFLGAWGVTAEDGLMDGPSAELDVKIAVIRHAKEVIGIVDGTKFGRPALASFAHPDEIHTIVTDSSAQADVLEAFREQDIDILVVPLQ